MYVISNTDTRSFRYLDLWLERVDTETVHQNFARTPEDELDSERALQAPIDWNLQPKLVVEIIRDRNFDMLSRLTDVSGIPGLLDIIWQLSFHEVAAHLFPYHLAKLLSIPYSSVQGQVLQRMIDFVTFMPSLVIHFVNVGSQLGLAEPFSGMITEANPKFLRALIMCIRKADSLVISYVRQVMERMDNVPIETLRSLVELLALTGASPEVALSLILDAFEPYTDRISCISRMLARYALKAVGGIAIDHIEEASELEGKPSPSTYSWTFDQSPRELDGNLLLECAVRIDAPRVGHIAAGDHVVFTSTTVPSDVVAQEPSKFEAIVQDTQTGQATLHLLRRPPAFLKRCTWRLSNCGSFVTSRTMMDAVVTLMTGREESCGVFRSLFHDDRSPPLPSTDIGYNFHSDLNKSQNAAVHASLQGPLTCIWGPPGTGKTHTIVTLCQEALARGSNERLLVTAPTHNAVDNVMRQYIKRQALIEASARVSPLRISTEVSSPFRTGIP